jgi:hypothetical protein
MLKNLLLLFFLVEVLVPNSILAQENPSASGTYNKYTGTIGTAAIVFDLIKKDNKFSGSYYYAKIGTPIEIVGEATGSNTFKLTEFDSNYEITGTLTCNFINDNSIEGLWENPKTKKTLPIKLIIKTENTPKITLYKSYNENCDNVAKNKLKPANEIEYFDTLCSTLSVDWLVVKIADATIQKKINQKLKELLIGNNATSVQEYVKTYFNTDPETGFNRDIICNPSTVEKSVLSFSIVNSEYFFGAAHPGSYLNYANFDITTGNIISLEDLFISDYKKELNQIAEKKFIQLFGTEGWDFTPGNFNNTENYLITKSGLIFTFNQYEIGPYAAGSPTFLIPYKDIKHLLKDKAVVRQFF